MSAAHAIVHAFADEAGPARALADKLGIECALIDLHTFPDGEVLPTVPAVAPTTILYRTLARPNDKLVALLLACDALRRAGARRLVLAAPYLCYMRQDAVFAPGQPVSQDVIGALLGPLFDRIVTVDAHLHRTRALADVFPQCAADDLCAAPAIADFLAGARADLGMADLGMADLGMIVGPDAESEKWVAQAAAPLGLSYLVMTKQRRSDTQVRLVLDQPEQIKGVSVALVDDVCSSGGTLIEAVRLLKDAGARRIIVCVTHALFDQEVDQRLRAAGADEIVSTDAVAHATNKISLAPVLGAALAREVG